MFMVSTALWMLIKGLLSLRPILARCQHLQARVRMHLVEVLERGGEMRNNGDLSIRTAPSARLTRIHNAAQVLS